MRLLIDEMYPQTLAAALRAAEIEVSTVGELGLAGSSDPAVFAAAVVRGDALLTENVADYARIAGDHLAAGQHHPGVLIALSSRFSRRPAGIGPLVAALRAVVGERLDDRVVYLAQTERG